MEPLRSSSPSTARSRGTQHCHSAILSEGDSSRSGPSFCKIISETMVGSSCNSWLQIPSMFVQKFLKAYIPSTMNKTQNKEVSLEGPNGKIWLVSILGWRHSSLGFKKGWRRFAIDHSLVMGDVVVFRMTAKGYFLVQIFGKWGLEKGGPGEHNFTQSNHGKRKNREEDGTFYIDTERNMKKLKADQTVSNICNKEESETIMLDNENDNLMVLDEEYRGGPVRELFPPDKALITTGPQPCQSFTCNSSLQQITDNTQSIKAPHTLNASKSQNVEVTFVLPKTGTSLGEKTVGVQQQLEGGQKSSFHYVSRRRSILQSERENAVNAANLLVTSQPACQRIMTASNVYKGFSLRFPRQFARYLPKKTLPITLVDCSGKEWVVKWMGNHINPGISAGWCKFSLDHCLEEGDVCVFELKDKKEVLLKVHIFRVVELREECSKGNHLDVTEKETWGGRKNKRTQDIAEYQKCSPFSGKMRGAMTTETQDKSPKTRPSEISLQQQKKLQDSTQISICYEKRFDMVMPSLFSHIPKDTLNFYSRKAGWKSRSGKRSSGQYIDVRKQVMEVSPGSELPITNSEKSMMLAPAEVSSILCRGNSCELMGMTDLTCTDIMSKPDIENAQDMPQTVNEQTVNELSLITVKQEFKCEEAVNGEATVSPNKQCLFLSDSEVSPTLALSNNGSREDVTINHRTAQKLCLGQTMHASVQCTQQGCSGDGPIHAKSQTIEALYSQNFKHLQTMSMNQKSNHLLNCEGSSPQFILACPAPSALDYLEHSKKSNCLSRGTQLERTTWQKKQNLTKMCKKLCRENRVCNKEGLSQTNNQKITSLCSKSSEYHRTTSKQAIVNHQINGGSSSCSVAEKRLPSGSIIVACPAPKILGCPGEKVKCHMVFEGAQVVNSKGRKKNRRPTKSSSRPKPLEAQQNMTKTDPGRHYEVERLISRRRGDTEDEFLVQLSEPVKADEMIKCSEEDGAWWVPLSNFRCGFKTCHL